MTADTALRLGKFFKTTPAFWMNIQAQYDLETAEDKIAPQIKKISAHRWCALTISRQVAVKPLLC